MWKNLTNKNTDVSFPYERERIVRDQIISHCTFEFRQFSKQKDTHFSEGYNTEGEDEIKVLKKKKCGIKLIRNDINLVLSICG